MGKRIPRCPVFVSFVLIHLTTSLRQGESSNFKARDAVGNGMKIVQNSKAKLETKHSFAVGKGAFEITIRFSI